jgi:hypothetical protein
MQIILHKSANSHHNIYHVYIKSSENVYFMVLRDQTSL